VTGAKGLFKLLDMMINEDERTKVFREYLEDKTGCMVSLDRLSIPGITENFEIHNLKISSERSNFCFNAELVRLASSQLATFITAGKILLNSDSDIPVERLEIYGLYSRYGNEDAPPFELFVREAILEGIEFKVKYDHSSNEPVLTGTISTEGAPAEITLRYGGVEIPVLEGNVALTLNLKTLTGKIKIEVTGPQNEKKTGEKTQKNRRKEKLSLDSISATISADFTLFPYIV